MAARLEGFGTTIFAEMSALAVATGALNLGQGFPDMEPPAEVADAAIAAIAGAGRNQYPPGIGVPELRHAIAEHQRRWYGLDVDPDTEVLVATGATEGIAAALLALVDPGDEVVMFEPYYDSYAACVSMAGGVRRVVPLRRDAADPSGWSFDADELRSAVGPRAKLLLINSPHNPTGKILTADERQMIADLATERDLVVVTDEVYEHLAYDARHVPLATLPGMAERTLAISSGGKTFRCTGWKVGWLTGPADLVAAARTAKQFLTYVSGGPLQYGIATGLGLPDAYFDGLRSDLAERRDRLAAALTAVGLEVPPAQGGYFLTTDVAPLGHADALVFCRSLPDLAGLVAVPSSVFYDDPVRGASLVRWAFCKSDAVLDEAIDRLARLKGA